MTWVRVKDKLPYQEPEHLLTYDYVLVASNYEPGVVSIARYTADGWEFLFSEDGSSLGVTCGDIVYFMELDDITHWMPIPKFMIEDDRV